MKKLYYALLAYGASICFASAATPQKLTVVLDWFPNPDHAPLIIAKQQGYFKKQGLDVELVGPTDPADPIKWVAAGKADIGLTYEPQLMEQVDHGLPLIRIGTLIDKPLNCLVALKDGQIKSPTDLKGKRIGVSNNGVSSAMLKVMLAKQGLKEKDIEIVNIRYNLTQALLSHQVDATTGMMRNYEVPQLESKHQKVVAFFPEEHGIPNYSELIFISHKDHTKDPRLGKFLAAIQQGVRYLDEHPNEAWQQFAKQYPESNNAINREAWFATIPYFAENPTDFDHNEWHQFAVFMQQNRLIKNVHPVSDYAIALPAIDNKMSV